MIFPTAAVLLTLLPSLALSLPATSLGSKHTAYLVRCQHQDCLLVLCDDDSITGAAYFRNGPVPENAGTRVQTPTTFATLSGRDTSFETKRTFRFGSDGTFTTNIPAEAKTAAKGSIAGDATLGEEPFVCFKDGSSQFRITYDDERYTCTTDYYCPSIDVGSGQPTN